MWLIALTGECHVREVRGYSNLSVDLVAAHARDSCLPMIGGFGIVPESLAMPRRGSITTCACFRSGAWLP